MIVKEESKKWNKEVFGGAVSESIWWVLFYPLALKGKLASLTTARIVMRKVSYKRTNQGHFDRRGFVETKIFRALWLEIGDRNMGLYHRVVLI